MKDLQDLIDYKYSEHMIEQLCSMTHQDDYL